MKEEINNEKLPDKSGENQENQRDTKGRFLPGVSGNPLGQGAGRPVGPSLKTWLRKKLESMTEEERFIFLEGIPKLDIWKMAEGNPDSEKKPENPEMPAGATTRLAGEAFFNEDGKLIVAKQIAEYVNGISRTTEQPITPTDKIVP